ncbi:hypothetical protein CLV51_1011566 [Chitinophaga niastensis]|uniref:Outer membrane protein with beta-barrel domain n=1 Tax=Chitinophaga niastensis TaxID=536980 RepID=A0A2P8HVG8_CHINA|nr:hypothetical protein [Chitinophaga niastensis]PSL50222.1 hypothetical protein CLV51_1011566 [Chitinophaga niastensis]
MFRLYTLLCAVCCSLSYLRTEAQSKLYSHTIGAGLYTASNHLGGGIVYSPSINFLVISPGSTFSIGTHIGLGTNINANYNSSTGGNSTSIFMADVPLIVAWNFGNAATSKAYTKWGVYAGAGYGFHNATRSVEYFDDEEVTTNQVHVSGIVMDTGVRFPIANSSWGARFSYMLNNNQYNPDITGIGSIGIEYNIGVKIHRSR